MNRRNFLKYSISLGIAGISSGMLRGYGANNAWAAPLGVNLSDPAIQPLFTEPVINALSNQFKYRKKQRGLFSNYKTGAKQGEIHSRYKIAASQITQETGLVDSQGNRLVTTVWGYGNRRKATWPGRTIEVKSNEKTTIKWQNKLAKREHLFLDPRPVALPHLLPVDESLHWCYNISGYESLNVAKDGVPLVTHVHGAHVDSASDGNPEYFFGLTQQSRGPRWTSEDYHYDNSQPAGTLWYHDHALGITRLNVYAGLAGFYIIRDELDTGRKDNPLSLPAGPYEHGYAVQDRMFKDNGELFYPAFPGDPAYNDFILGEGATPPVGQPSSLAEFFGDHIVVNGKIWPKVDVEPRHYRLRLLNGCDSRFMRLRLRSVPLNDTDFSNASDPLPFYLVGSDQGLLAAPISVTEIDFMPAERLDIVFDFSSVPAGTRIIVENILGDSPFDGGIPDADFFAQRKTDRVMAFDVTQALSNIPDNFDPARCQSNYIRNQKTVDKVRKLALFEGKDEFGRLQPMLGTAEPVTDITGATVTGSMPWHHPITENPELGATEIWEIYNTTADAHPIHVHLVHFDILDRAPFAGDNISQDVLQHKGAIANGFRLENIVVDASNVRTSAPSEQAPKDMVVAYPGEVTRIKMTFDKSGRYVWHCHILSHEDHDMMRPFHVGTITA
jgi:FtsP/CotA-like multicopper oxidase with cupredoxin domain